MGWGNRLPCPGEGFGDAVASWVSGGWQWNSQLGVALSRVSFGKMVMLTQQLSVFGHGGEARSRWANPIKT